MMLKKASFTIEAVYIIPLMLIFITSLLGFTYFTHQHIWCKGAAYESLYYGMQFHADKGNAKDKAESRLQERIAEIPLEMSPVEAEVSAGPAVLKAKTQTGILPDVFGDIFTSKMSISAANIDAAQIKKAAWILRYVTNQYGS